MKCIIFSQERLLAMGFSSAQGHGFFCKNVRFRGGSIYIYIYTCTYTHTHIYICICTGGGGRGSVGSVGERGPAWGLVVPFVA